MENKYKTYGELISEWRMSLKVSQAQFAKTIGTTPQFLSNIERGAAYLPAKLLKKLGAKYGNEEYNYEVLASAHSNEDYIRRMSLYGL